MLALVLAAALAPSPWVHAPVVVGKRAIPLVRIMHWQRVIARNDGQGIDWRRARYRTQAAEILTTFVWVEGEAARRGIVVTRREVDRAYTRWRREDMPRARDLRRFLRASAYTVADVRRRLRVEMLGDRIRDHVVAGLPEGDQQPAMNRFVAEWEARWRAVTHCIAPYLTESCAEVTPPAPAR
jgi:hypothetical protein